MKVHYDEKADAVYIRLRNARYYESDEIKDGVILDYDRKGKIIGIEILDASEHLLPDELTSMQFEIHRTMRTPKSKRVVQ